MKFLGIYPSHNIRNRIYLVDSFFHRQSFLNSIIWYKDNNNRNETCNQSVFIIIIRLLWIPNSVYSNQTINNESYTMPHCLRLIEWKETMPWEKTKCNSIQFHSNSKWLRMYHLILVLIWNMYYRGTRLDFKYDSGHRTYPLPFFDTK